MKKLNNTTKVLRYVKQNPLAKAKEVAQAVGVPVNTVYQTVYLAKKKLGNGQVISVLAPNAQASLALFGDKEIQRASKSIKDDTVNHPSHYKVGGIETIDFIEAKKLGYNLGNVVKYVSRADYKGRLVEDLLKAQWYLAREIADLEKGKK
jgi:prolyl-tRNA editing enzyme YbaK/EbsC (Cys-tRNA(Pro) deacylase)